MGKMKERFVFMNNEIFSELEPSKDRKSRPIIGVLIFIATLIVVPIILFVFDWIMTACMGTDMGWVYRPVSWAINYLSWPVACFFAYLISYAVGISKTTTNVCAIVVCVIMVGFVSISLYLSVLYYIPMYILCVAVLTFLMWGSFKNYI